MLTILAAFTALATLVTAAPQYYPDGPSPTATPYPAPATPSATYPSPADATYDVSKWTPAYKAGCDASTLTIHPGYGYTAYYPYAELAIPEGQQLKYTTVGRGVQKYTCTGGVYVHSGAAADLYDTSCYLAYYAEPDANADAKTLPQTAYDTVPYPYPYDSTYAWGKHEYVATPDGHKPKLTRVSDNYYTIGARTGWVTPDVNHIEWVRLEAVPSADADADADADAYGLASTILRTDTVGGVAPPYCDVEGYELAVPYAANYYFYA